MIILYTESRAPAERKLWKRQKMAGADEFIKEMAMGYDTYVGERGVKLSEGRSSASALPGYF